MWQKVFALKGSAEDLQLYIHVAMIYYWYFLNSKPKCHGLYCVLYKCIGRICFLVFDLPLLFCFSAVLFLYFFSSMLLWFITLLIMLIMRCFFCAERIHQAQAAAAKARKALQQKPKPTPKPVSPPVYHNFFFKTFTFYTDILPQILKAVNTKKKKSGLLLIYIFFFSATHRLHPLFFVKKWVTYRPLWM